MSPLAHPDFLFALRPLSRQEREPAEVDDHPQREQHTPDNNDPVRDAPWFMPLLETGIHLGKAEDDDDKLRCVRRVRTSKFRLVREVGYVRR